MLTLETNSISDVYFNITGVTFASTPDPPQFEGYCVKYTSQAWYNGSNVLNITYDYLNRTFSAAINNQVNLASIDGYTSISL
uniref:Uncharacterized protein n=1 Tax=Acrobeloides nanus TaxID=290746 RepID=A0A914EGJ3_9BILA